jgi:hypothetical protein
MMTIVKNIKLISIQIFNAMFGQGCSSGTYRVDKLFLLFLFGWQNNPYMKFPI